MSSSSNHYQTNYFLNHSVGLPFPGSSQHFQQVYFDNWQQQVEPWHGWLDAIDRFRSSVAKLINGDIDELCPQVNLSSSLTKILYALPKPSGAKNIILCSEEDFPSMAFVLSKAQELGYQLKFIAKESNLLDLAPWQEHLSEQVALCLITQVQSNNGRQLPVKDIIALCKVQEIISIVDVAQGVGILPIDCKDWQADFVLGSCVKWLSGGPGAGFLWVNQQRLAQCQPVDVGWFSHQNPFEFDIHHFDYHSSALRFWGGTPSVASYVIASHAIDEILTIGVSKIRAINCQHQITIRAAVAPEHLISPLNLEHSSGTVIVHFANEQERVIKQLTERNIAFDQRQQGIRLSPHFYTTNADVEQLLAGLTL